MKKYFLVLFLLAFVCTGNAQNITPEFLWKLGRVSDPQLSPDGKECLYNVRSYSLEKNKGNSDVWKVTLDSGKVTKLAGDTSGNETSAKWSADGKKIFYLNDKSGSSQLWSMNADGSNARAESNLTFDINAYGISGAGNIIWLAADVKVDKTLKEIYPDLPKTTGRVFDDLMFRHWDTWFDGTFSHIFISRFENGKITDVPKDIMPGERFDAPMKPDGGEEQIAISADGNRIAYTCKKLFGKEYAVSTNSDIYIYDAVANTTTNITEGLNGYDKDPRFSPDGKKLIWKNQTGEGNEASRASLFIYDFATKEKKEITKGVDYNVAVTTFNNAGTKIYFIAEIKATQNLFCYDLTSPPLSKKAAKTYQALRQLTNDVADHLELSITANSKGEDVIITSRQSMSAPTELFSVDAKTGVSKQITFTNKNILSTVKLARVEKRMIKSTDGKEILTWIIYPPDFDATKKYPTLLYCQGGPQSMLGQFFSYRWNFQLMAANGYVIVAPNRRGLPGFGEAWNDEISLDWGGQPMRDLLSAIDSMAKEPFVNKEKLGAVGASYGGYSVFWLAGNHNKRFKAFIAHDGVFNLESMNASTEEIWFPNHEFGGQAWNTTRPDNYQKFSPNKFVKNWDTPILVITNDKDYRVPVTQGLEAYTAARLQNIPARLLNFPDENHWVLKPQNSVLWQRIFYDWLDKYLK